MLLAENGREKAQMRCRFGAAAVRRPVATQASLWLTPSFLLALTRLSPAPAGRDCRARGSSGIMKPVCSLVSSAFHPPHPHSPFSARRPSTAPPPTSLSRCRFKRLGEYLLTAVCILAVAERRSGAATTPTRVGCRRSPDSRKLPPTHTHAHTRQRCATQAENAHGERQNGGKFI